MKTTNNKIFRVICVAAIIIVAMMTLSAVASATGALDGVSANNASDVLGIKKTGSEGFYIAAVIAGLIGVVCIIVYGIIKKNIAMAAVIFIVAAVVVALCVAPTRFGEIGEKVANLLPG